MNRRIFVQKSVLTGSALMLPTFLKASGSAPIRVGIIGLDTSHAPAFAKIFNSGQPGFEGFTVVAAYPKGSEDIPSSVERIPEYTATIKSLGIEITSSVQDLLNKVDVVLLETNDGRPHLNQALEVIKAGKPVFIDKPVAGSLRDAIRIYSEAEKRKIPVFSSSALRYIKTAQQVRYENKIGKVLAADTFSPATIEPHHPDLFWYGIHGVETLFTVMGPGCESVSRITTADADVVVGSWQDGRIGTFRGTRTGTHDYGGFAFGSESNTALGTFEGYEPLAIKIAEFFRTGITPVNPAETLEIYAFMEAADESKRRGGAVVRLLEVMKSNTKK
jgi:hypothetical protein